MHSSGNPDCTRLLLTTVAIGVMLGVSGWSTSRAGEPLAGEVLYNGIRLPSPWPPADTQLTLDAVPVPYLSDRPKVISIEVGRQLFVDDFLIEQTNLNRTFHAAEYHPASPVLKPDRPWEMTGENPTAMVFSDGVWFDPKDQLFKMWYMGGYVQGTCYATSRDGLHWEKPSLDVTAGTNVVLKTPRDSSTIWLDLEERDPQRRYKLVMFAHPGPGAMSLQVSPDGIHWGEAVAQSGPCGDRTTFFWNPFRRVWVYSIRSGDHVGAAGPEVRTRRYHEGKNAVAATRWQPGEPVPWVAADGLDLRRKDLDTQCQLYNLDAVAYESILLGLFSIWRGQPADRAKPNEVVLGYSRDGFHWHRPIREAFLPVSERYGDWNWGNVQSTGGCCLVVGDRLYFYVSGRAGIPGSRSSGVCSTGLATLRRDGFASMDAGGSEGTLTTHLVRFMGSHLFVNADVAGGELRAEVLDNDGRTIDPFSRVNCQVFRRNSTLEMMQWRGGSDLSNLTGRPVRFRFHVRNGKLYAFWVSRDLSGASRGYVAAGGPEFTGPTDTIGSSHPARDAETKEAGP